MAENITENKELVEVNWNDVSAPNQCEASTFEGRHVWESIGYEQQSIEKFVCKFCLKVIYD